MWYHLNSFGMAKNMGRWLRVLPWLKSASTSICSPQSALNFCWSLKHSKTKRSLVKCVCYAGFLSSLRLTTDDEKETDPRKYITEAIQRALYNQQEGDFKKAEQQLHLALKMAQETVDDEAVTYIYDTMANLAHEAGKLEDAERLFVETSKRLLQRGTSTEDDAIIEISVKMADIYAEKGKLAEAEIGFLYCLDTLQKKINSGIKDDNTKMLWAMCEDAYGRFLIGVGRHEEAGKHFREALDASENILGTSHPQTLVLVNNLGSAKYMSGDYAEAAKYMRNAANIASSTGSTDLSAYYRNLGMVYLQLGQVRDAELACKKALETASNDKDFQREARMCLEDIKQSRKKATT